MAKQPTKTKAAKTKTANDQTPEQPVVPPWQPELRGHGMDAVSAHLDRGWDLLQRGDLERAKLSAEAVLKHQPHSPEGFTLLGAIAAASGKPEEALTHYNQAMEIDPGFIDPVLYAAETYLSPLEDLDQALLFCEQALEIAEEEDEFLDALLLKAEVEIAMDNTASALRTLGDLPPVEFPEPAYHLRAARSYFDLGEVDDAADHYQRALERDQSLTDALHGLGLCAEMRGDERERVSCFQRVRDRDLREARPPWSLAQAEFEGLCQEVLQSLPDRMQELLENVPVVATDYPSAELVSDGLDPRVLGFFVGTPHPNKSHFDGTPRLDCIYLYQRNIERIARTRSEAEEEVEKTLLHEAGHFFGLSEEELSSLGLG